MPAPAKAPTRAPSKAQSKEGVAAKKPAATKGPRLETLVPVALSMRERAYAPYSNFTVGAALLAEDGTVYTGCNVENASYGLCLCAERTAVAKAVSEGARRFAGIVIATGSHPASSPCGMCRQVLAEFAPDLPILLVNDRGSRIRTTARKLLPLGFDRSFL